MSGDFLKPAVHSRDHRDDHTDPISGPWFTVLDEGDDPPDDTDAEEDIDYIFLQNGATQPTAGSGLGGADLEPFSFRRGLSRLDTKGTLDCSVFASGDVAFIIPEVYRLPKDDFFFTIMMVSGTPTSAMVYLYSATGEVTITFPVV